MKFTEKSKVDSAEMKDYARVTIELGLMAELRKLDNLGFDWSQPLAETTALALAAKKGSQSVIEFLVKKGLNLETATKDGDKLLHLAARGGHEDLVIYLVKKAKMSTESRNNQGQTPLLAICAKPLPKYVRDPGYGIRTMKQLVVLGADLTAVDVKGNGVLHLLGANWGGWVSELLKIGASGEAKNQQGQTPMDVAMENLKVQLKKRNDNPKAFSDIELEVATSMVVAMHKCKLKLKSKKDRYIYSCVTNHWLWKLNQGESKGYNF